MSGASGVSPLAALRRRIWDIIWEVSHFVHKFVLFMFSFSGAPVQPIGPMDRFRRAPSETVLYIRARLKYPFRYNQWGNFIMEDQKGRIATLLKAWKAQDIVVKIAQLALFASVCLSVGMAIFGGRQSGGAFGYSVNTHHAGTVISILLGFITGVIVSGALILIRHLFSKYGTAVLLVGAALFILVGDVLTNSPILSGMTSGIGGFVGFAVGVCLMTYLFVRIVPPTKLPNVFGNSRWATLEDLVKWGLLGKWNGNSGLFLGQVRGQEDGEEEDERNVDTQPIVYEGDMHALTVAPTRRGKGATAIIPNLQRSESSILVIDPKGENARCTVKKRLALGQNVRVVDPWGISCQEDKYNPGIDAKHLARFNPLAALAPDDPDLPSDAMLLADALVLPSGNDPFWGEEAKALIQGFILYVVTDTREQEQRHLGRVRDILSLRLVTGDDVAGTMTEILDRMAESDNPLVNAAAFRLMQKSEKERAGVLSMAQASTHFLDSPKIRESLSGSDFKFSELKTEEKGTTVYLVLPLDRLPTYNKWLRLLISSAMIDLTRVPARANKPPVRVILDEFAALEKLAIVETAFGTMAGLGVQLWIVTQDLGQLMRLYGDKSWQTFVSNAGVFQYFGSRDHETAQYAEHLCGVMTMKKRSLSFGSNWGSSDGPGGSSSSSGGSESITIDDVARPLAYADQMMTLHRNVQVLFIENHYPIMARKWWWFEHQDKEQKDKAA